MFNIIIIWCCISFYLQWLWLLYRVLSGVTGKSSSYRDFTVSDATITTGLPSPPRTPSSTVVHYGRDSIIFTIQWQLPQYDGGAPVNYTITVSPGLSPLTTSATSVPVILPYNVTHTVSIVAINCNGSSSATMQTIGIGMLQI